MKPGKPAFSKVIFTVYHTLASQNEIHTCTCNCPSIVYGLGSIIYACIHLFMYVYKCMYTYMSSKECHLRTLCSKIILCLWPKFHACAAKTDLLNTQKNFVIFDASLQQKMFVFIQQNLFFTFTNCLLSEHTQFYM